MKRSNNDCGVEVYFKEKKHDMKWEEVEIFAEEASWERRRMLESIFIAEYKEKEERGECTLMNLKDGDKLPLCWNRVLRKVSE